MLKINKDILRVVVEKMLNLDYGETITHDDLSKDFVVKYDSGIYRRYITALKHECLENGKLLENILRIGYRITNPDDYSRQALTQFKYAAKKIKKGEKILNHAPINDMSKEGLTEYRQINDRARALNAHISGAIVELKLLKNNKNHPLLKNF